MVVEFHQKSPIMRRKTREKPPSVSGFLLQYRQELMVNHGKGGLECKSTQYTQDMYYRGVEAKHKKCIEQIKTAITQMEEFIPKLEDLGEKLGYFYEDMKIQKVIVSFEPLLGLKGGPLKRLFGNENKTDWKVIAIENLEEIQPYIAKGADFWSFLIEYDKVTYHDIHMIIDKMKAETGADDSENVLNIYRENIFNRLLKFEVQGST